MRYWWLSDFVRVGLEKAAVEALAAEGWFKLTRWIIHEFRFAAEGIITAHGAAYPVRLVYPDQFPLVPAWVEPQDPTVRWSGHQYGEGGLLCLELRPDNWHPSATGADVLRSAYGLLSTENPLGQGDRAAVPSAHRIPDIQSYDWGPEPILIGAGCLRRLKAGVVAGVSALRWQAEDKVWPILVFDAADRAQPQHPPSFDWGTLRVELPVIVGFVDGPALPAPSNRAQLEAALRLDVGLYEGALVGLAVGADQVTAFHSPNPESAFRRKLIVLPDQAGLRSGRPAFSKMVAVVGLGSVGSKVAEMLLRSGVHRLLLIDGDVFLPANLERHTLDWRDVGFRKVNAVQRRLLQIVPGASVEVIAENLDWQRSARTHAGQIERIVACDLIVDASGDIPTALMLGALAAENGKPFVSVQVFEGGLGCAVARSLPGRDPPYALGRAAYNAYCEQRDVQPPKSGQRTYEVLTEEGDPLVADDAAVSSAAAFAARVVLDILDDQIEAPAAWMLVGFRRDWLFEGHGHTIGLDMGPAPPASPVGDDTQAHEFTMALAEEFLRAAQAS